MNGTFTKTLARPGMPVHIVIGAGGAYSKDPFTGDPAPADA